MFADMCRALPCGLVFLAAVFTAYASRHPEPEHPRYVPTGRLRPISISKFEAAIGLERRSLLEYSNLDLQAQSELIYGSPGGDGQLLLANMTLYAPDGLLMIMMERFEGLTSSVDCQGDDGSMSLTFSSLNAFNHAVQSWSYINENDDGQFLLIANHEGCGPDDHRQPYLVSKITEDTATLTTYLNAKSAPWSDVAGTYDLDFGQAIYYRKPQLVKERSFWGDIENVGKDVLDAATGSVDLSETVNFPMNIGQQGQRTNIYTDDKGRLNLDCINCFLSGSFAVTGHISVDHFSLQDLILKGSPQGLQAALQLEATITSSDEPDSLQYTKELFSFPVPEAGIEVEGIFKLGATLSYDIGVSSSFSGSATIDFGLQAGIPDSAQVTADIQKPDSSSATGWSGGSLTPLFDIKKESASVKLAAFSQPKLAFGIELIEIGNFDVALTIKLPEVSITLTAAYAEDGVCGAGSSQTGIELDSEVDIEVDLQIDAELGDDEDTAKPSWSHTLYAYPIPLGSLCFPLDILGLNSSSSTTMSVLSLPASTLQPRLSTAGSPGSVPSSAVDGTVGVTATLSESMTSDGPTLFTGVPVSGVFMKSPGAQSGQSTDIGPASSNLPTAPSDGFALAPASSAVEVVPLHSVTVPGSHLSKSVTSNTVLELGLQNGKAKATIAQSHVSSMPPSSSDVFSFSGLAGAGDAVEVPNPTTTSPSLIPTSFVGATSATVAIGNENMGTTVVHSHTHSIPPTPSDTLSFPGLADHDDRLAAIDAATTTMSPSFTSLRRSSSIPAVVDALDDRKAAVLNPKTRATTMSRKSAIPPFRPKATPPPDPLPQNNPAIEKNVNDLPLKPEVVPPPPAAKKPAPVISTTTSNRLIAATTTTPANRGGGCRIMKRFEERMLIC